MRGRFYGRRVGPRVTSEADHVEQCKLCGQFFDRRKAPEMLWHEIPAHPRWNMSREVQIEDVFDYLPPELFEHFFQLKGERKPKAQSLYRGINIEIGAKGPRG
jgi:hypothetical protein